MGVQVSAKNLRLRSCVCGVLAAAAFAGSALAQEKTTLLEEVIVTAQKRSESLQEVPIAISVFSSEQRDQLGIISLQDFTNFTPGITYSTSLDRMSVRGIGRQTNNLATSAAVATYGDGFYNSSNHQADTSTMFTESVEVLRGPQGTLYGRNSIGGTLNVKLRRPSDEWGGEARAVGGSFGRREFEATVTGPITDWLRFRLGGGFYNQSKGFVENIVNEDDGYGERKDQFGLFMLEADLGEHVDLFFKYSYMRWDQGYGTAVNLAPYATSTRACTVDPRIGTINPATGLPFPATPTNPSSTACRPSLVATGSLGPSALYNTGPGTGGAQFNLNPAVPQYLTQNPGTYDHRARNQDTSSHNTLKPDNIYVLEVVGHLGFADLKYIGGYHNYEYILNSDFDNSNRFSYTYTGPAANALGCGPTTCNSTPVEIYTQVISTYIERKRYYSNELNLISSGDGPIDWVGGVFQYHEYYEQPVDTFNPNQTQLRAPQLGPANPNGSFQLTDAHTTTKSMAAFGQVDWHITDAVTTSLGLRYTKDKKSGVEFARRVSWNPTFLGAFAPAFDITALGPASGGFNSPTIGGALLTDGTGRWARSFNEEWDAVTGTLVAKWSPIDGGNGYLSYNRGYKDGGVNAGNLVAANLLYTDPEYVNAYEAGWKQELGGRFTANVSVFYYDYKDAQFPLTLVNDVGTTSQIFNIDSISRGLELETVYRPFDDLQLLASYAYLNTSIKDERCYSDAIYIIGVVGYQPCSNPSATGGAEAIKGNDSPGSPEHKFAANALYTVHTTPGSVSFSASYIWRSTQYSSIFSRAEYQVPSYDQWDFRAIFNDAGNRYSVIAWVRNAFDNEGFDGVTAAATASGVTQSYSLTPPRHVGVEFQYRFGSATGN